MEAGITGKKWNYSPTVESYYPKGYIDDDMWDLTHIDYDNNNMDKAYKYHMDNDVPNYDNGIIKPHNTITIPIYKGIGFSILYDLVGGQIIEKIKMILQLLDKIYVILFLLIKILL